MRYLSSLLVLLLVCSLSTRASPIVFDHQEPQKHSKIIYNDDGTIKQIIMPDGRILNGGTGVICREGCGTVAEESLREEHDRKKWIIGGLILGGGIICAVLCRPGQGTPPPTGLLPPVIQPPVPTPPPPTPPPATPVPEPGTLALLAAGGLFLRLTKRRRGGE